MSKVLVRLSTASQTTTSFRVMAKLDSATSRQRHGRSIQPQPRARHYHRPASSRHCTDPSAGSLDLPDLDKHNAFEHDASLSWVDFAFSGIPGDAKLNFTLFDEFLSFFDGMDYITIPAAAAAQYNRVKSSRAHTPGFTYGPILQITSYAETIKYFRTMIDPTNGLTSKQFVKILFGKSLNFSFGFSIPFFPVAIHSFSYN